MAGDFKPQPRVKTILDNPKLRLVAPNAKGKMASLSFQNTPAGNPRIVVWTNDPDDTQDYGKITAAMEPKTFFALMQLIRTAANAPGEYREKIDNMHNWVGGQRSDKPQTVNSTIVSKDTEGVIYITISAPRRPNIKFPFMQDDYHHFVKSDGSPLEKAEVSKRLALSWVKMLESLMSILMVQQYVHPEKKDNKGGGNRTGGNFNRGGGGGNYGGSRGGESAGAAAGAGDDLDDLPGW